MQIKANSRLRKNNVSKQAEDEPHGLYRQTLHAKLVGSTNVDHLVAIVIGTLSLLPKNTYR